MDRNFRIWHLQRRQFHFQGTKEELRSEACSKFMNKLLHVFNNKIHADEISSDFAQAFE
jgi:hypothetical protein